MLMTLDYIGHLKMLCMSRLSLSSGVESIWKHCSSLLSIVQDEPILKQSNDIIMLFGEMEYGIEVEKKLVFKHTYNHKVLTWEVRFFDTLAYMIEYKGV